MARRSDAPENNRIAVDNVDEGEGEGETFDDPRWDAENVEDLGDAESIIGGHTVEGGDQNQRIFNFALPFSAPLGRPFDHARYGLRQLGTILTFPLSAVRNKQTISMEPPMAASMDIESDDEHDAYALGKLNPRAHAIKSSLKPKLSVPKLPNVKGNVLILGGYRGSRLVDAKTGRTVWIPLKVGFRVRKINLEIGPSDKDELEAENSIKPTGILSQIGPVDICRRLTTQLRSQPDCEVTDFGYDWRQSLDLTSAKLYKVLEELYEKSPTGQGTIVIAHSMGGLVAHHALQRCIKNNKNYIRGVIYAGSPSECQPILGPLKQGEPVIFAKDILTPKANFLMRSSFAFLPRNGRCFVHKDEATEYKLDFYDVKTWIDYELSPCVSRDPKVRERQNRLVDEKTDSGRSSQLDFDVAVEYLERTLKRTRKFHEDLKRIPGVHYPPMAVVYGNTLPACRGALVNSAEDIRHCEYNDLWYSAGDGVVSRKTLVPLQCGFPEVPAFASKQGHIGLLSDLEVMSQALTAVLGEEDELEAVDTMDSSSTIGSLSTRLARTTVRMTRNITRSRSKTPSGYSSSSSPDPDEETPDLAPVKA